METIYAAACCCYMTVLHIVNGEVIHILSSGCTSLTAAVTKGRVTSEPEWRAGMWENQKILSLKKISLKWPKCGVWCEGKKEPDSCFFLHGKIHILSAAWQLRCPHTTQHHNNKFHYATMMDAFIVKWNDRWQIWVPNLVIKTCRLFKGFGGEFFISTGHHG